MRKRRLVRDLQARRPGEDGRAIRLLARMTQQQVADALGCSRARVQQLENSALAKLRAGLEDWA